MSREFPAILQHAGARSWAQILGRARTPDSPRMPSVAGRRVLVTGAAGYIGSAMVQALAVSGAERVVLLDLEERALVRVQRELTEKSFGERCVPVAGNVCDRKLLTAILTEHRPEMIVHAAALKHVPLMERDPFAAVETNALGTWLLAHLALEHRVRRVILVSTDKAVAPHSIMGASKKIAELAMLAQPGRAAVRLVNVIGSPGSVGPLFAEQIARGGPVTVTHPRARRFFFTLDEVIALLAEAVESESAQGVLVPDAGDAMLISDLAGRMIAASGREVPTAITRLRPGDKLEEALVSPRERCTGRATPRLRCLTGPTVADVDAHLKSLAAAIAGRDPEQLLRAVDELVPDYEPSALLRELACALR